MKKTIFVMIMVAIFGSLCFSQATTPEGYVIESCVEQAHVAMFNYSERVTLNSGESRIYTFTCPSNSIEYTLYCCGHGLFTVYEGATITDKGTLVTTYSRNRNNPKTTALGLYHTPTIWGISTEIDQRGFGLSKKIGGSISRNAWVLESGSIYVLNDNNRMDGDSLK